MSDQQLESDLHEKFIAAIVASVARHGMARTVQEGAERAWVATSPLFLSADRSES